MASAKTILAIHALRMKKSFLFQDKLLPPHLYLCNGKLNVDTGNGALWQEQGARPLFHRF